MAAGEVSCTENQLEANIKTEQGMLPLAIATNKL
jgi:hypothetical protein